MSQPQSHWSPRGSPTSTSDLADADPDADEFTLPRSSSDDADRSHSRSSVSPQQRDPASASTPSFDAPLLPERPPARSHSSSNFVPVSSPLNPASPASLSGNPFRSRPQSAASQFVRMPSEDAQALSAPPSAFGTSHRGSMLLYRLAASDDPGSALEPPSLRHAARHSVASTSGDSVWSLSGDSKYPSGSVRGLIPYAYDPESDEKGLEDDDALHDPKARGERERGWGLRGIANVGVLVILVIALLSLFILYPMLSFFAHNGRNLAIDNNININGTGQNPDLFQMPQLVDPDTPQAARTRKGFDGQEYDLVFSDEFNTPGRTFYPGDDPFWEAQSLWYWPTADQEWYDPAQATTADGALRIVMEQKETKPGLPYTSAMLQSWNKFCFSSGYIEVAVTMPGPDENTQGYWPGAWTMGNLGRPGYGATTDGMWPYSYSSCDIGTFPNQTTKDKSGPPAALHTDMGRDKYNFELSWLSGQRLSACTCPGEDHPGPDVTVGRGAPEIDILEVEKNKLSGGAGQVVSQSAQFAPFTADYQYKNDSTDAWAITDPSLSWPNTYKGSAVQQAVSGLTRLPSDMFQGSGQQFKVLGFEYWSDPNDVGGSYIQWVSDGKPSVRMGASSVGPDAATGVGQRLISQEPMSIVLNLGISSNWQTISLDTMTFPAVMLFDYVRVYQRKGKTNIGCDPSGFPTQAYIDRHMDLYTNANLTTWPGSRPKNRLYDGC